MLAYLWNDHRVNLLALIFACLCFIGCGVKFLFNHSYTDAKLRSTVEYQILGLVLMGLGAMVFGLLFEPPHAPASWAGVLILCAVCAAAVLVGLWLAFVERRRELNRLRQLQSPVT